MVGDKVRLAIKQYPYEREGTIIKQERCMCIVEVKYPSGYTMRFRKHIKRLQKMKG